MAKSQPQTILTPDELDARTHFNCFCGMPTRYSAGEYWGFLELFRRNDFIYTELATSRDGRSFQRLPERPKLIDFGPKGAWDDERKGRSWKPVLDDPASAINDAAFRWYPKGGNLGVAIRTDRWRLVEWTKTGEPPVHELYDQSADPQNDVNIAEKLEHADLISAVSKQLRVRFAVRP
jgi:hypothetical protein